MKENSIEETIKQLELILKARKEHKEIIECAGGWCVNCDPDIKALTESIDILKDYKRVLKENEELKAKWDKDTHILQNELDLTNADKINNYIPAQKVKDKIEEYNNEIGQLRIERNVTYDSGIYKLELKREALQELLEKE